MRNLVIFFLLFALSVPSFAQDVFVNGEPVLTPETKVVLKDGDYEREVTGEELWSELTQYEEEVKVTHDAQEVRNGEEEEFVVPMSLKTQEDLQAQKENFDKTALDYVGIENEVFAAAKEYRMDVGYNRVWGKTNRFAAYIDAKAEIFGDAETRKFHSHLYGGGYVFSNQVKVLEFNADISNGEKATANTSLKIFGKTKFSASTPTYSKKIFFTGEKGKKVRFFVGPVPVSVYGSIGGSAGMDAKLSVLPTGLRASVTPGLTTFGRADAAVDLWFVRAGVAGSLDILIDHLPIVADVQLMPGLVLDMSLQAKNQLKSLSGKVDLFVQVRKVLKFWKKEWKKYSVTLFKWNGIKKDWVLLDKEVKIALK